ncbi:MAG: TIR domain-containing protein [Bacteroidia bacterium]|nr:TIR domain-containing protein [Bacteroidia bacterium]
MSKSIFISCVFEDRHRIDSIKKWVRDNRLGDVAITHETEDKRQQGKEAVKRHIKSKIEDAAFVMVLVGQDTHNHEWIEVEVELSNSFHKEIICVRVPHTTGAVPSLLANKRLISFDPEAIKKLIS